MYQMNRLISKLLCVDMKSTMLLSRVIIMNKSIIDDVIANINNRFLQHLIYRDSIPLKEHQCYSSLEKIIYQDWTSITSYDIQQLKSIGSLYVGRVLYNIDPDISNYVETMKIKDNIIIIRMKLSNKALPNNKRVKIVMNHNHQFIVTGWISEYITVSLHSDTVDNTSYIYDVNDNGSILKMQDDYIIS